MGSGSVASSLYVILHGMSQAVPVLGELGSSGNTMKAPVKAGRESRMKGPCIM